MPSLEMQSESRKQVRENRLANLLPWVIPVLVYLLLLGLTLRRCERVTGGSLVYAVDDAYIHMSVAKTLLAFHSYGLQPHEFSSPESSILWPFLVALGFRATGSSVAVPLLLNVFFAIVAIAGMNAFLVRLRVRPVLRLIGGLLLVWLTPLVPLSMAGMEHIGQCASVLIFAGLFALTWERDRKSGAEIAALFCAAAAMVLFRYEGLFVAFAAGVLLAWKGRWKQSGLVLLGAGLPAATFALWLTSHGHFFLPDSMIVKRPTNMVLNLGHNLRSPVGSSLLLSALCLFAILVFVKRISASTLATNLVALLTITIHLLAAPLGWFFRYEAYLVALLTFASVLVLRDLWESSGRSPSSEGSRTVHPLFASFLILALMAASGQLIYRGKFACDETPVAAQEIYLQQMQMARFFGRYYRGQTIAVNDIGAVSFFAGCHIFDVYGLASHEVAKLTLEKRYTTDEMVRLATQKNVEVAAVYESLFAGGLPMWFKAGSLSIQREAILVGKVSFYARTPCKAAALASHLQEFQKTAPAGAVLSVEPQAPGADCPAAP